MLVGDIEEFRKAKKQFPDLYATDEELKQKMDVFFDELEAQEKQKQAEQLEQATSSQKKAS